MIRGLYTASTALEQHTKAMNVISNNLANVNTRGFKTDITVYEEFSSYMINRIGGSDNHSVEQAADVRGKKNKDGTYELETKNGYFTVNAIGGNSHHKSIAFRVDDDMYLKTFYRNSNGRIIENQGNYVLGKNGAIKLESKDFDFDKSGNIIVNSEIVDNIISYRGYGQIGTMSGGIRHVRTFSNHLQGELEVTHNPLDIAISGRGFITIETPAGTRYTRDGQLKISSDGTLLTDQGFKVAGIDGDIVLENAEFGINEFGEITSKGQIVDKIKMLDPKRDEFLLKKGDNLYSYETEITEEDEKVRGKIIQGALEGSNVNQVEEMVKMIETYRAYESAQRVLRTYDESIAKSVNEIAKI